MEAGTSPRGFWRLRVWPLWIYWPLLLVGQWFIVMPVPIVFGLLWEFYALGLVGAVGLGIWTRRAYSMTVEQSDGVTVTRVQRRRR